MKRNSEFIFAIIGVIALVGSLIAMWLLVEIGGAISYVESTQLQDVGQVTGSSLQPAFSAMKSFIWIGWIWSLSVLIASAYTVYNSIQTIRVSRR